MIDSLPKHNKTDATSTIQELKDACAQFIKDRDWQKYHTARNLAVSIAIEAAELMEHFQWGTEDIEAHKQDIAYGLADVISYCLNFAQITDIDISEAFYDKLELTKLKYPTAIFNSDSTGLTSYNNIKAAHRYKNKKGKGVL